VYRAYAAAIEAGSSSIIVQDADKTAHLSCSSKRECIRSTVASEVAVTALQQRAKAEALAIIDTVLRTACPRCDELITAFDGCFVVQCSNCSAYSCGFCSSDCGGWDSAHTHVKVCTQNNLNSTATTATATATGTELPLYGSVSQYEAAQHNRVQRSIGARLDALEKPLRGQVRFRLAKPLAAVGIVLNNSDSSAPLC
jgi:hypothetical protein